MPGRQRRSFVAMMAALTLLAGLTTSATAITTKIATTLTIEATPNPAWVGESVAITFTVTPIPDGGEITLGGPGFPVDPVTGTYVMHTPFNWASTGYVVMARYTGTDAYQGTPFVEYSVVVRQHPVTATLSVPAGPLGRGDPFDVTVDLDEAPDGGRILIQEMSHGNPGPTLRSFAVSGTQPMTISMPGMEPGDYLIRASFEGTDAFTPAISTTLPLTVFDRPTTTTLVTTTNPTLFGEPISLSVSVSPIPDDGGSVGIEIDGSKSASFDMDWATGVGTATLRPIDPGDHTIKANFNPTGNLVSRWAPSSDSVTQTVSTTPIEDDPPVGTVLIDGGAEYSASGWVVISMKATDASGIVQTQMSCDDVHWRNAGGVDADWGWGWGNGDAGCEPNDGVKTMHVRWRDTWGTWGEASDSIILDWNAPTGEVVADGGAAATTTDTVFVTVDATDGGSGVDVMALSNDGSNWTEMPYAPVVEWSLTGGGTSSKVAPSAAADGVRSVYAKWRDGNGHWSNTEEDTIILDLAAPTGSVSIAGGAAYTTSPAVTLAVPATDAGTGVSEVALSNDGSNWTTRAYAATQSWTLPATNGTRAVFVRWRDGAGHWSAVTSDSVVFDAVAPLAVAPRNGLVTGTAISAGRITTRLTWSGSDTTSGVARYELQQQTDGGAWSTIATSLTGTTIDRSLPTQHTYAFRVRAVDKAGNVGAWATAATARISTFGETSSAMRYSGSWHRTVSSVFWGGAARMSTTAGSKASLTFSGRSVSFVSRLGPTKGKARIYVDGIHVATLDLYAGTFKSQRVVWTRNFATSGRHTVTVVVVGTSGRPRIDVDGFVVGT